MELDKIISNRYSVREFKKKDVDYKLIGELLDVARKAPSSGNLQNWRFLVVKDKEKKESIAKACLDQDWMKLAPAYIVVCYDERDIKTMYPQYYAEFSLQNTAIAATHIMLKAVDIGLGSCWVAVFDGYTVSNILKLPEYIKPALIIVLGYPDGVRKKKTRMQLDKFVWFEEFGFKTRQTKYTDIYPLSKHGIKVRDKVKWKLKKKR